MSDVFISYARSTEAQAKRIAEALRALGYGVWRDDELPAHRSYAEVIEERLNAARAVVGASLAHLGRPEEARGAAARHHALTPQPLEAFARQTFLEQGQIDNLLSGMALAEGVGPARS